MQFKVVLIEFSYIIDFRDLLQVGNQSFQFLVIALVCKGDNWYSVFNLFTERIRGVVHYDKVFQASLVEYAKIFNIDTLICLDTRLSIVPMRYIHTIRVQVINDNICITGMGSSKDNYLEDLGHLLKKFIDIRSYINLCL